MRMSLEQFRELSAKVQYALSLDMDPDKVQQWILDPKRRIVLASGEDAVMEARSAPASVIQYPPDNVPFELAIPEPFTGLQMVRRFGYDPTGWKFNGTEIAASQKKKFMLVSIGYQPNFEAVKIALAKYGSTPPGQWLDAFKKAFPTPDGKGPIGVADSSWVDPDGDAGFPSVDSGGDADFSWTGDGFIAGWRWLVEAQA